MPAVMSMPPLTLIGRALRDTTEHLAHELAHPQPIAPAWSNFDWDVARAAAAIQGIGALLALRLRWNGPSRWRQFLNGQLEHGQLRSARIDSLLLQLDELARRAGVAIVALKGAALMRKDLYAAGARPMGDIDLLVQDEDLPALARALTMLDYQHQFTSERHVVFSNSPPALPHGLGEHADNPLKIEVHTRVADRLPVTPVDITAQLWPSHPHPGINPYPDDASLLLHLLLHAAGNMRAHALRLIQLEDIARLTRRMSMSQWQRFRCARADGCAVWWALPPLLLAQRYCGAPAPAEVIAALREATPRTLWHAAQRHTLTDVSWSNLHISAFPGIEWSRSMGEALRYARSRVAPDRTARDELEQTTTVQPLVATLPWYQLSHHRRILRWLGGRAPRVQAMTAVLAALDTGERAHQRVSSL